MENTSYTIEDLYYNIYYPDRLFYQLTPNDNFKYGLNDSNITADRIQSEMRRKIWLANSPPGWTTTLDEVLAEHYSI